MFVRKYFYETWERIILEGAFCIINVVSYGIIFLEYKFPQEYGIKNKKTKKKEKKKKEKKSITRIWDYFHKKEILASWHYK